MDSVKKNYFYNTALQVLMMIVPIITTPYLSRVIGVEGIGTYSYYYAVVSYFKIFIKLGIDNYGNREVAEHRNNSYELKKIFSELVYLQLISGLIIIIIYIIYAKWLSSDSSYAFLFILTIFATCIDINWFLYGIEKFKVVSVRNALVKLISTILIFALVKNSEDIFLYCLILNLCDLVSQVLAWPIVFKDISLIRVKPRDIFHHIKPNVILFMSLISVSIFKTMDKIMLGFLSYDKVEVGFYESAERIIHIPNILVISLGTVMMPRITNMIASNDKNYKNNIFTSIIFSMAIASSMSFGIMGIAREFVPMFYGSGFEKCIDLYLILLPCCLFMAFATVIRTQYLLPNHKDKAILIASFLGAGMNLVVNWILIPVWGSVGAAVATLISEVLVCLYQVMTVVKELNIKKYLYYSIQFVILGGIMFVCIYLSPFLFIHNIFIRILIKIFIGTAIFLIGSILILWISYKKDDKDMKFLIDNSLKSMNWISRKKEKSSNR